MDVIGRYLSELRDTLSSLDPEAIATAIAWLHEARLNRRQIFIMGNGGSASTASHFVCDLAKNTRHSSQPDFRVIGLTDNMALMTAYANDDGYHNVFAFQLANFCQPQDVVIAISTSGRSPNVLEGVKLANQLNARTIGFTGFDGGDLRSLVDLDIHVPSHCIEHVEDIHLVLEHLMTMALRELVTVPSSERDMSSGIPEPVTSRSGKAGR